MLDKNVFDRYLLALRKTPIDDKTEHTDRPHCKVSCKR
jgi:hypothetical protein